MDICTEENIYDEPHRLAISDRSAGGHMALENQVSFTLDWKYIDQSIVTESFRKMAVSFKNQVIY